MSERTAMIVRLELSTSDDAEPGVRGATVKETVVGYVHPTLATRVYDKLARRLDTSAAKGEHRLSDLPKPGPKAVKP